MPVVPIDAAGVTFPTAACLCADISLPQSLGDEEAIYQRTRTRMPLNHVSLEELDALLGKEDEGLFDEEGEQYQQFLRVGAPGLLSGLCAASPRPAAFWL